jgi:hypothetical protein
MRDSETLRQWERDCRSELAADHENDVFLKLVLLARIIGYSDVSLGIELPTSAAEPSFSYWCTYPQDWLAKFVERDPRYHGSRAALNKRKSPPARGMSENHWSKCDFEREAQAYGIVFQVWEAVRAGGGTVAFIGLSGRSTPLSELVEQQTRILIDMTVDAITPLLLDKHLPEHRVPISEIERRYMCWVLDGKTAGEIQIIMGLTKAQVDAMQRALPQRFGKKGIFPTSFFAWRMDMLEPPVHDLGSNPMRPASA